VVQRLGSSSNLGKDGPEAVLSIIRQDPAQRTHILTKLFNHCPRIGILGELVHQARQSGFVLSDQLQELERLLRKNA